MVRLVALELERPADQPSPWRPLLDLWAMGVWPLALPGGDALVWVPQLDATGVPILNAEEADVPQQHGDANHEATGFLIDDMRELPVLFGRSQRRMQPYYGDDTIEPSGMPAPAQLRVVAGTTLPIGSIRKLGATTQLARPVEALVGYRDSARPDFAEIVFRDGTFWITHTGRQWPSLAVNGVDVHNRRPLFPGDVIHQLDVRLAFELT